MVYLAFAPNDKFWKNTSSNFFKRFLSDRIDKIADTKVELHSTKINDKAGRNVLYYTGHGSNRTGVPCALGDKANLLVDFLIDRRIGIDRICFLSCHTYEWVIRNYREFSRLLRYCPWVQVEGDRGEIDMRYIHAVVEGVGFTSLEFIRMSRIDKSCPDNGNGSLKWGYAEYVSKDASENLMRVTAPLRVFSDAHITVINSDGENPR